MEDFDALFLDVVLRAHNEQDDALAISTSTLYPCEGLVGKGKMEIVFRPSIPNDLGNC